MSDVPLGVLFRVRRSIVMLACKISIARPSEPPHAYHSSRYSW
jgi:hypothetical protein